MTNHTLYDRCRVNTNTDNDVFVGLRKNAEKYEVSFPLGYHLGKDEKSLRKDILLLLKVLAKYSDRRESALYRQSGPENFSDLPVYACLYLIKDFLARGYYQERDTHYQTGKKGKINWRRTVQTQKPWLQGRAAYYLDFVVKKDSLNENKQITLVHKYCVYESFRRLGWLFTSFVPADPKITLSVKRMTAIVMEQLQRTFHDRNKQLFRSMLSLLRSLNDERDAEFHYGTSRFAYVWEKMIDQVFGSPEKSKYFPQTVWHLAQGESYVNSCLEPDSIMLFQGKVYVLDAKYYKFGWSGAPAHLPESSSIHKQITYGEYIAKAEKFMQKGRHPVVYNAFLLPYDAQGPAFSTNRPFYCLGTAVSDWKTGQAEYENVVGILLDTKYLMSLKRENYPAAREKLAALIEEHCFAGVWGGKLYRKGRAAEPALEAGREGEDDGSEL